MYLGLRYARDRIRSESPTRRRFASFQRPLIDPEAHAEGIAAMCLSAVDAGAPAASRPWKCCGISSVW